MAFEDNLGNEPLPPQDQDYTVGATGLVSRTLSLWTSKLVQYIIIVGIAGAACVIFSFVLVYALFGTIGVLGADPIDFLINQFFLTSPLDTFFVAIALGFGIFAFVLNAFLAGAAIKFTLDEYGGPRGDIGTSYSHSLSRLLNLVIVQLLFSAMLAVVLTPFMILSERAIALTDFSDINNPIILPGAVELMMQALGFLVVGGIIMLYVQIRISPTLAIVVDTELSAIDSLKKSWELTSGHMMHVFGGLFLMAIVTIVLNLIVIIIVDTIIAAVITPLFFGALTSIYAVVLYRDLSSRKDTSQLPGYVM